ncbi:Ger(x)C family spore germination protein [Cohnella faecalis]|uniref:Ger(X)C family spore germination protein n=1 Tax=Cohnella faecalis TaxID=2315694 RepID=A0A398CKI6_9BACL|nr:Ger(x)C family spore germination protein [Cohnella faecalis]RIE02810.1 Ger(x)C family spore germination protein [Cohnella faecalis]
MKPGKRLFKLAMAVLATAFAAASLSGCWNSRELNKLAIVTALAIDRAPDSDKYKLAFQVVMPGELSRTSGSGGGNSTPVSIYEIEASTLFEGIRRASKQVPRQLFFSHVQVVVLGERLAKDGIEEIFDFFERSHEVRLTSMLLIARDGSPLNLISSLVPMEKLQANALQGASTLSSQIWSESTVVEIDDVIRKLINPGAEPTIGGLKLIGDDKAATNKKSLEQTVPSHRIELSGIAMFKEGKLAGWLDDGFAKGFLFATDRVRSTVMNLNCEGKREGIALEVVRSKASSKVTMKKGKVKVDISVTAEGNVGEVKCGISLDKLSVLRKLEKDWSEAAKVDILGAVYTAQQYKADIFGFGEFLERYHPKEWRKVKDEWGEAFAKADVNVSFRAVIRRTGMRGKSLLEKTKEGEISE